MAVIEEERPTPQELFGDGGVISKMRSMHNYVRKDAQTSCVNQQGIYAGIVLATAAEELGEGCSFWLRGREVVDGKISLKDVREILRIMADTYDIDFRAAAASLEEEYPVEW